MTPDAPDVAEMVAWCDAEAEWRERGVVLERAEGKTGPMVMEAKAAMLRAIAERLRARGGT